MSRLKYGSKLLSILLSVSVIGLLSPQSLVYAENIDLSLNSDFHAITARDQSISDSNLVLDGFKDLSLKPSGTWWSTFFGGPNGVSAPVVENVGCAYMNCVQALDENGDHFARLSLAPYQYSNVWVLSELSDIRYGFRQGEVGKFTPQVGHPVLLASRFRFSSQYNTDGSGHVGSAGIWLWNAPINFRQVTDINGDPSTFSADAMGMTMMMAGGLPFFSGMRLGKVESNFPDYQVPSPSLNLQDWNTMNMLWSVDASGNQKVDFYINGQFVTSTPIKTLSNLSVEIWVDNQTINANGTISRLPVPSSEYMDVDYVVAANI